jgi:hypothetical protein
MKLFLDSLFYLGAALSLMLLFWGGWLVLRESLAGTVFPAYKELSADPAATDRTKEPAPSLVRRVRETKRAA